MSTSAGASAPDMQPDWAFYQPAEHVDVRGVDVAYRRKGSGDPVLYLHGIGMTRRWLPLYEELSRGCDLIVPEHPGFGETSPSEWIYSFEDLVLHYAELCDALDLETFHLVGHSFGGWIAAEFGAFYPERLRSLTLITPMGLRVEGQAPIDIFRLPADKLAAAVFNDRADEFADYADDGKDAVFQRYAELTAAARVGWNPRYDFKLDRRLGRITCPAVVIAADDDRVVPPAQAERYAELLPNGRLVNVSRSGNHPSGHGLVAQESGKIAHEILETIRL
ncbi:MAG TPA: alpha/beta hydrolase [Baekduia sp.]|nr:alpha/beta hydrolase [Baekduia sp.]